MYCIVLHCGEFEMWVLGICMYVCLRCITSTTCQKIMWIQIIIILIMLKMRIHDARTVL